MVSAGLVGGPGAQRALVVALDLVAADLDRLDAVGALDGHRRAQEAQRDPLPGVRRRLAVGELAQQRDVLARGERALLLEPLSGNRVELHLVASDDDVDPVEAAEVAQLGAGEGRLRRAAAAEHDDLLDLALAQRLERVVGDVGALELGDRQREDAGDVGGDVAVADDHRAPARQVELEVAVVGVAVVPGHELGGGPAPGQLLAGDAERLVGLRAGRVDDGGVVAHELGVREVDADVDVAEEAHAARERLPVEGVLQALDLLVVGGNAAA